MMACSKRNTKQAAKRSASAVLAGAVAVGMMPAAAFADDAPASSEASSDEGIELLVATGADAFARGSVTAAQDNTGAELDVSGSVEFAYDGSAHYVVPTEFTPESFDAIDLTASDSYKVQYFAIGDNGSRQEIKDPESITDPGTYCVQITDKENSYVCECAIEFSIAVASFEGIALYQVNGDDASDFSDTTFEYTGSRFSFGTDAGDIGVVVGSEVLVEDSDFTVEIYAQNSGTKVSYIRDAGTYVVKLSGIDVYAGEEAQLTLTVDPIDLSEATIELNTSRGYENATLESVNGIDATKDLDRSEPGSQTLADMIDVTIESVPDSLYGGSGYGVYTYLVSATARLLERLSIGSSKREPTKSC